MSKTLYSQLRSAANRHQFVEACRDFSKPDVIVNDTALARFAQDIDLNQPVASKRGYVRDSADLPGSMVDLAVSTAQQSGYIYADAQGAVRKWEIDGSGAKALTKLMDDVRSRKLLPGIDIADPAQIRPRLKDIFNATPFAEERLKIWEELARPQAVRILCDFHDAARRGADSYHFLFADLRKLEQASPTGFGADPFLKKAALLPILFAALVHEKNGPGHVTMDSIVPADYRVPQTLRNIGLLDYSAPLQQALQRGDLLPEDHSFVTQIRAATVVAMDDVLRLRPDMPLYSVNSALWSAGRAFDNKGGEKPMNVATMRF